MHKQDATLERRERAHVISVILIVVVDVTIVRVHVVRVVRRVLGRRPKIVVSSNSNTV